MTAELNRRQFIETTAAAGAITILPRHVLGGKNHVAPSDKINLAHIGMGTQSIRELGSLLEEPRIQIVSICDPNKDSMDYIEWRKNSIKTKIQEYMNKPDWRKNKQGCPGGREVGKEIVETWYANQREMEKYKGCSLYADFRELFEKENDIDAVKIMTPDHLHATLSIAAMKNGIDVIMHKPVANRMYEARKVLETANQTGRNTHLLAYGSGTGNAKIVELIKQGIIGSLREIHTWSKRPVWPQYSKIPEDTPKVPKGFDWDLWLGPSKDRPYHPHYTHSVYRGWYEFGGGAMADMGIYNLWPVFTGLNLGTALSAKAWSTHTVALRDQVSGIVENDFSYPSACVQEFQFAATEHVPELELFWYDGGIEPRFSKDTESYNIDLDIEGILFQGDTGAIIADFHGTNPRLLAKGDITPLKINEPESDEQDRKRRKLRWLDSLLKNEPSPGRFQNATAITDTINLGTIALRAGKKVIFDSDTMQILNDPDANTYLHRDYRPGWEL